MVRADGFVGVVAPDPLTAARALESLRPAWSATTGPSAAELEAHLRANPTTEVGWGGDVDERTGNVDVVTLALNLYTQGVHPGLDFSNINEAARCSCDWSKRPNGPSKEKR